MSEADVVVEIRQFEKICSAMGGLPVGAELAVRAADEIERLREALKRAETCIAFFRSLLAEHKQDTGSAFVLCCEEALEKYDLARAALHTEGGGDDS